MSCLIIEVGNLLLSVIIPAYNCKDTLSAAVNSVAENFKDTEIIIIDDGSTDGTSELIADLKNSYDCIVTERISNSGPANARNYGISKAFLINENKKAHESITTPHCRIKCAGCGSNKLNGGKCDALSKA